MMGSLRRETQGLRSHFLVISKKKKKKACGFWGAEGQRDTNTFRVQTL